jgi:hypothetical protein
VAYQFEMEIYHILFSNTVPDEQKKNFGALNLIPKTTSIKGGLANLTVVMAPNSQALILLNYTLFFIY